MGCLQTKPHTQLEESEDIRDAYRIGALLGSGSFGQVRDCVHIASGEARAVKTIEKSNETGEWSSTQMFRREIKVLHDLSHPCVIKFHDFYEDDHLLYVVMEKCWGGEVFQKILELRRFKEADVVPIITQMLSAIEYIHGVDVVHRDIKAENFLFVKPDIKSQIKLIDFGLATKCPKGAKLSELCGSPHYLAPEMIAQSYAEEIDLWSLGVLLYLLLFGKYPFDGENPQDIMMHILVTQVAWSHPLYQPSVNALDFMRGLMTRDKAKRLTAAQALSHPFLTSPESEAPSVDVPSDNVRSAVRRYTQAKKKVSDDVQSRREKLIAQIQEEYSAGVKRGCRLNPNAKPTADNYRHANKLQTAPADPSAYNKTSKISMGPRHMDEHVDDVNSAQARQLERELDHDASSSVPEGDKSTVGPLRTIDTLDSGSFASRSRSHKRADTYGAGSTRQNRESMSGSTESGSITVQ